MGAVDVCHPPAPQHLAQVEPPGERASLGLRVRHGDLREVLEAGGRAARGYVVRISPSTSGWNCGNTVAVLTPNRVDTTSASTER